MKNCFKDRSQSINGANKRLVLHVRIRCGSMSITTQVSLLANEFDARSVLHGQVSLADVNQICVIHEAMNGCKNLKKILMKCFGNVNIKAYPLTSFLQHVGGFWVLQHVKYVTLFLN